MEDHFVREVLTKAKDVKYEDLIVRTLTARVCALLRARKEGRCPPNAKLHHVYNEYGAFEGHKNDLEAILRSEMPEHPYKLLMETRFITVTSQNDRDAELLQRKGEFISAALFIPEIADRLTLSDRGNERTQPAIATYNDVKAAVTSYVKTLVDDQTVLGLCYVSGHGLKHPGVYLAEAPSLFLRTITKLLKLLRKNTKLYAVAFEVEYSTKPVEIVKCLSVLLSLTENECERKLHQDYEFNVINAAFFVGFEHIRGVYFGQATESNVQLIENVTTEIQLENERDGKIYKSLAQCISGNALYRMFENALQSFKDLPNKKFPLKSLFVWIGCYGFGKFIDSQRGRKDLSAGSLSYGQYRPTHSFNLSHIDGLDLPEQFIHKDLILHLMHFYTQQPPCTRKSDFPCCFARLNEAVRKLLERPSERLDIDSSHVLPVEGDDNRIYVIEQDLESLQLD